ncbi:hypothetical protein CSV67_03710 [Sporosarcina sp. P2]|uniref:hypothetical protein n=1 Tax=Sporosarcina sp. P2 TaxID=2048251 RepID=UPI000C169CAA|nr:hypothetical protein [Sporosarcina sp. P2]PID03757.1 hypothetical protein CSV67_03710 [Sporosarcina sp. P2]
MNLNRKPALSNTPLLLLKAIRDDPQHVDDIEERHNLYFSHADIFRKWGEDGVNGAFGDRLDGYYIHPPKPRNNYLNIRRGQKGKFDREFLAKIDRDMLDVYMSCFFYITVDQFQEKRIPSDIIDSFKNEFQGRRIAFFHGVKDLEQGLLENDPRFKGGWMHAVEYKGLDDAPLYSETEYDKHPELGYAVKRRQNFDNQQELRIYTPARNFDRKFIDDNPNGFHLHFGDIGREGRPGVRILNSIEDLYDITISSDSNEEAPNE